MPKFDLKRDGEELVNTIKMQPWFPYKTGNLRNSFEGWEKEPGKEFYMHFNKKIAPYVVTLEEGKSGTSESFVNEATDFSGKAFVGIGRPRLHIHGSSAPVGESKAFTVKKNVRVGKHVGFIKNHLIQFIIDYFIKKYDGELRN